MNRKRLLGIALIGASLMHPSSSFADVRDYMYGSSSAVRAGEWAIANAVSTSRRLVAHGCPMVVPSGGNITVEDPNFGFSVRPTQIVTTAETQPGAFERVAKPSSPSLPFLEQWRFNANRSAGKYTLGVTFAFEQIGYVVWLKEDIYVPLPGDTNGDGRVAVEDYKTFLSNYGQGVACSDFQPWTKGDFNADGLIDGTDFSLLAANYGRLDGPVLPPLNTPECPIRQAIGSCNRANTAPSIQSKAVAYDTSGSVTLSGDPMVIPSNSTASYFVPSITARDAERDGLRFAMSLFSASGVPLSLNNLGAYTINTYRAADGTTNWSAYIPMSTLPASGKLRVVVSDPYTGVSRTFNWMKK